MENQAVLNTNDKKLKALEIAGAVFGLLSIPLYSFWVFSLLGLSASLLAQKGKRRSEVSRAGFILSLFGLAMSVFLTVCAVVGG